MIFEHIFIFIIMYYLTETFILTLSHSCVPIRRLILEAWCDKIASYVLRNNYITIVMSLLCQQCRVRRINYVN